MRLTDRISIGVLGRLLTRDVVDEVISECGRTEQRKRLLPARVVVYFVVAMSLFFVEGYEEVMRRLVGGLRFMRAWRQDWQVPTAGAISQARERLGEEPLRVLFERVAVPVARPGMAGSWLRGWRLMAIDGVMFSVPDTPANAADFGRMKSADPFPKVRMVGLGECGTHAVVAAEIGPARTGERELAEGLVGWFEPGMLIIADRGFFSYALWTQAMAAGADLLFRVANHPKLPVQTVLPDGSYLSTVYHPTRGKGRTGQVPLAFTGDPLTATEIPVRVIEYTITNRLRPGERAGELFCLVTTIVDPDAASSFELAAAYHERWEYELSLKEIETQLLTPGRTLRSKKPELARQEIWGLLLAHYAIRSLMTDAADIGDIDPDRLSFIRSLNLVRRQVTNQADFSP